MGIMVHVHQECLILLVSDFDKWDSHDIPEYLLVFSSTSDQDGLSNQLDGYTTLWIIV